MTSSMTIPAWVQAWVQAWIAVVVALAVPRGPGEQARLDRLFDADDGLLPGVLATLAEQAA